MRTLRNVTCVHRYSSRTTRVSTTRLFPNFCRLIRYYINTIYIYIYIIYYRYYCYYLIEEYSVASLHHHARPSDTPRARTEPTKVRVPTLVCHITCFLCLFSVCERVFICSFFLHAFSHRVSLYIR